MRFTSPQAFGKHVKSADVEHLSKVYLILDPERYVQKKLANELLLLCEGAESHEALDLTQQALFETINSMSMFSQKKTIAIFDINALSAQQLKSLSQMIKNPPENIRFVLTGQSLVKELNIIQKEGIVVDLTQEKPWDKDKRLVHDVLKSFQENKLRIATFLAEQIVKSCGSQVALIDQEVEKLICYLHGQGEVKRQDLDLLGSNYQSSLFKIGQALLEKRLKEALTLVHQQSVPLMVLVSTLRTIFQRSLRIKSLTKPEISKVFPQLKGSFLEKNIRWSQGHTQSYLKRILSILFEVELLFKSQPTDEIALKGLLVLKIGLANESLPV